MSEAQDERSDIPKLLVNTKTGDAYHRLRFFGKVISLKAICNFYSIPTMMHIDGHFIFDGSSQFYRLRQMEMIQMVNVWNGRVRRSNAISINYIFRHSHASNWVFLAFAESWHRALLCDSCVWQQRQRSIAYAMNVHMLPPPSSLLRLLHWISYVLPFFMRTITSLYRLTENVDLKSSRSKHNARPVNCQDAHR